jgi:hypothetical protein
MTKRLYKGYLRENKVKGGRHKEQGTRHKSRFFPGTVAADVVWKNLSRRCNGAANLRL